MGGEIDGRRNPGLYVYHCASPHVPMHLGMGMYGMILVEPKEGLPKVDRELYVMQGEYYTRELPGFRGEHQRDTGRLLEERPTYVVMNGRVGGLSGERSMKAKVGGKGPGVFRRWWPKPHQLFSRDGGDLRQSLSFRLLSFWILDQCANSDGFSWWRHRGGTADR